MLEIERDPAAPPQQDTDQMVLVAIAVAALSQRARRAGTSAPPFRLRDHGGRQVSLKALTAAGPAVVHFDRGAWCTYCQSSLFDLAAAHHDIRAAGARVAVIAPPPSPKFLAGARASAARLPFTTLIDDELRVAIAYGVTYCLPARLRASYLERGYVPPHDPKKGEWLIPIRATYLIGRDGTILLSAVDVDYRNGPHAEQIVAALRALRRHGTREASGIVFDGSNLSIPRYEEKAQGGIGVIPRRH
jgi:peroxiredoxin